jgi:hypothetical protein
MPFKRQFPLKCGIFSAVQHAFAMLTSSNSIVLNPIFVVLGLNKDCCLEYLLILSDAS